MLQSQRRRQRLDALSPYGVPRVLRRIVRRQPWAQERNGYAEFRAWLMFEENEFLCLARDDGAYCDTRQHALYLDEIRRFGAGRAGGLECLPVFPFGLRDSR